MWDQISQICIFIFGIVAIVLVARKNKWGFVFGAVSQPFWFITSFINKQWGIFFVSFAYAVSWIYGIYKWFFKDRTIEKNGK